MKAFPSIVSISVLSPLLLSANLTFKEPKIVHVATLDETQYKATFEFTNESERPVKILDANSSCGCTTAMPSKQVFEPGESGKITATFDYGEREGKQIKSIRIETDFEPEPRAFLTLEVDIPTVLEVSPSVVMWNRATDTESSAKEVIIQTSIKEGLEIVDVIASSDLFSHEVKILEPGKKFALVIQPRDLPTQKGIIRGTFIVKTSYSNPLKGNLKVYAIVR